MQLVELEFGNTLVVSMLVDCWAAGLGNGDVMRAGTTGQSVVSAPAKSKQDVACIKRHTPSQPRVNPESTPSQPRVKYITEGSFPASVQIIK